MRMEQKKSRKELQAKITALKKSASKGDKKKKEFIEKIAKLQEELDNDSDEGGCKDEEKETNICGDMSLLTVSSSEDTVPNGKERISKAQKRRDKKAAEKSEREKRINEQERDNLYGARHLENEKIKSILKQRHLRAYEIPSNGDCLYAAVTHQLQLLDVPMSVAKLRQETADYMRMNPNTFLPFLCDNDTGLPMDLGNNFGESESWFPIFRSDTEKLSIWGGQPELQAISHILKFSIEVIQAEGPSIVIEEKYSSRLILIYYRHLYSLGEHYNSVIKHTESNDEDDFVQL